MAAALLGASSFGHAFEWDDDEGAWMVVVRKSDLSIAHAGEIPSMSTYHFAGAYETNDEIRVLVNELIGRRVDLEARFSDMYSAEWAPDGYNLLSEYAVRMRDGTLVSKSPVVPRAPGGGEDVSVASAGQLPMEFPVIAPGARRRKPRFVYTLGFAGSGSGYFDAVQRLDVRDGGTHQTRIHGPGGVSERGGVRAQARREWRRARIGGGSRGTSSTSSITPRGTEATSSCSTPRTSRGRSWRASSCRFTSRTRSTARSGMNETRGERGEWRGEGADASRRDF